MLNTTLLAQVRPEHLRLLMEIENEDYGPVRTKAAEAHKKEFGVEPTREYLDSGVEGLKQYYAVALLDPKNEHAVSAKVDVFWHAHILHSRQYASFCERTVGGFMHHVPLDTTKPEDVANVGILYAYTLEVMGKLFGELDPTNWPAAGEVDYKLVCTHMNQSYSLADQHALFEHIDRGFTMNA